MKYWVYKETRILGPFDKEAVSGLPGLDAGTLVCVGDPSGSSWVPAGELDGLTGISAAGAGEGFEPLPSSMGLLDQLQIDSAGIVGDNEFPDSLAENLFQDAAFKKDFSDILSSRVEPGEPEARHAREKISELTAQLEVMARRISELEAGRTDLAHRLAEKEREPISPAPDAPEAAASMPELPADAVEGLMKTFLSPASPPLPGGPASVAAVPDAQPPSSEWPDVPVEGAGGFPSLPGGPALPAESSSVGQADAPGFPPMPSFGKEGATASPSEELLVVKSEAPTESPRTLSFGKPKLFKIVPTVKSFKVMGTAEDTAAPSNNPPPEFGVEPSFETPGSSPEPQAQAPIAVPAPAPASTPAPVPTPAPAPQPAAPVVIAPAAVPPPPVPAPAATPAPAPAANPFSAPPPQPEPAVPTPAAAPPVTFSSLMPTPDISSGDMTGSSDATAQVPPPATMARSMGAVLPDEAVPARFAKPEPAPPTGEIKRPGRNNKAFLIGGGALVILLIIVGVIFMRQPKEDLRQMAALDDGKAPIGLPTEDPALAPPPVVTPQVAPPPSGPSPEQVAAIEAVKDFPLDGERGTVGNWLQYSYTASPGAGTEEWNASSTGDGGMLVEYRLVPGAAGGNGALYLFEIDPNGLVMGKNIEARQMLAGSPPPEAPKAKKKPVKKTAPKRARRPVYEEPKEVPLLPLPDAGELRPPAEDDGTFGSDTINSGL